MTAAASYQTRRAVQQCQDVSSGNIKQVLDILEALPSKTSDVEKFLKQAA